MPGGKFPVQSGKPVLITQAEFEKNCCNPCNDCEPPLKCRYTVTFDGLTGDWSVWNGAWTVLVGEDRCEWWYPDQEYQGEKIFLEWVSFFGGWTAGIIDGRGSHQWWGPNPEECVPMGNYPFDGGTYPEQSEATCVVS